MKIAYALVGIPAIMLLCAGCIKSEKKVNNDMAAEIDTVGAVVAPLNEIPQDDILAVAEADDKGVEQSQTDMLQKVLFDGGEDADRLRKYCTKNALKQLNDDYEYDDKDENSLAIWAISGRNGCDSVLKLKSLNKVDTDTYQAVFVMASDDEMVEASLMEYKLVEVNGEWKIDSYKSVR